MTPRRRQAGLSIVELIIGMAVTSLILTGIAGIIFGVNNSYGSWVGRIANAANGDVLAEAIQADSHRLIACSGGSNVELDFCTVNSTVPVVRYQARGPAPYAILRQAGVQNQVVARGLAVRPTYRVDCDGAGGAGSGYVEVDGITALGALRVYYRAPVSSQVLCEQLA